MKNISSSVRLFWFVVWDNRFMIVVIVGWRGRSVAVYVDNKGYENSWLVFLKTSSGGPC